jgi:CheY-like chemotaxis protein
MTGVAIPKILIVDDEPVIADTLAAILNKSGFEASAAHSGEAAIEQARSTRPELLITDVMMPDMNGIETAINIRKFLPNCRILLFSGQAATADLLESARQEGYNFDILSKPIHPQELIVKLQRAVEPSL